MAVIWNTVLNYLTLLKHLFLKFRPTTAQNEHNSTCTILPEHGGTLIILVAISIYITFYQLNKDILDFES